MIELRPHGEGLLLPIQAQPGARRNVVVGEHDGRLKVAVTQIAERGKANRVILKFLAKELGLKASQLQLLSGESSTRKVILIRGETLESLQKRLVSLE